MMEGSNTTEIERLAQRHAALGERFAAALITHQPNDRLPHLDWSVGELGRHVLSGNRAYRGALAGRTVWSTFEGEAENAAMIAATPERELDEIAAAISQETAELARSVLDDREGEHPWIADVRVPVGALLGVAFADLLVHLWDLARCDRRNPDDVLTSQDAQTAAAAALRVAPHFLTPTGMAANVRFELRLRGGPIYELAFGDGTVRVSKGACPDAQCRISADPVAFVLVAYGRRSMWPAALRGAFVAYGRRPWLALGFPKLLRNP